MQPEPKLILIPWEDKQTYVFQLKIGSKTLSRRIDNHTVNGTKLLNIGGLTRGRRDGILKNEKERNVIKHGPLNLKGVWIPLSRARLITEKHKITPEINIILEDDPSKYLKKESQLELEGKFEPYMRIKDKYADDDYISNKYSGVISDYYQNSMPSNHYITHYIDNNTIEQNNLTKLPMETMTITTNNGIQQQPFTQNISQNIHENMKQDIDNNIPPHNLSQNISHTISQNIPQTIQHNIQHNISQNIPQNIQHNIPQNIQHNIPQNINHNNNYMNPCDLDYIIHSPDKGFTYNGFQVQYSNINKSIKKNTQTPQQTINQFSPIPPISSSIASTTYANIYDNSNMNPTIPYNNSLPEQIHNSSYNNLSDYSPNTNV
ncbi:DNA-binding domain of Mlu1-box binding protein MBP1 [Piromyces finnis]|uniref:DNA-binding domain of Mlu1-box binding protein MBP1 n=1 Tax=Piromyces finnis TaxID=1754191 RepID=A0A1Y1VN76_9FUNG|nr:DNA-binding domain of Mlu1-box binding protein MBP1 [Piromyces finnis]|eukprot:ORX60874.1 DNA-binding domain of Mlu1-box binding protein MBP1 [Piromyces finnis]